MLKLVAIAIFRALVQQVPSAHVAHKYSNKVYVLRQAQQHIPISEHMCAIMILQFYQEPPHVARKTGKHSLIQGLLSINNIFDAIQIAKQAIDRL